MHEICVRGEVLALPKMCCCCGDPKAKKRYKAAGTYFGRWIDTNYREKRWWYFPICKRCDQWTRSAQAAAYWLPNFLGALALGGIATIGAVLGGLLTTAGIVWGSIAAVLLLYGLVAFALWWLRLSQSRRLDPGPPCTAYPVILTEWLRDKHTFRFSNTDYFHHFRRLNQEKIS
jgi:hypothetical protein